MIAAQTAGRLARQPIGHDDARHKLSSLQEFPKEPLRGAGAPATRCRTAESTGGWPRERPSIPRASINSETSRKLTETVIEPQAMTDDLRREPIAFVQRGSVRRLGHGGIRADHKRLDNANNMRAR